MHSHMYLYVGAETRCAKAILGEISKFGLLKPQTALLMTVDSRQVPPMVWKQ
jgi:hypothetical protein